MRISDWSSDVCSSDLAVALAQGLQHAGEGAFQVDVEAERLTVHHVGVLPQGGELHGGVVRRGLGEGERQLFVVEILQRLHRRLHRLAATRQGLTQRRNTDGEPPRAERIELARSEEHTSELQSLMRISYAVFCLKKKNKNKLQKY